MESRKHISINFDNITNTERESGVERVEDRETEREIDKIYPEK